MQRWAILSTIVVLSSSCGCALDEFRQQGGFRNKPVEVPEITPANREVSARVDALGHELLAQNPFLGVNPTFSVVGGTKELDIYHPDQNGVLITEALVARCQTDQELAAVLASEVAKMTVEVRASKRMRIVDPPMMLPDGGGLAAPGGNADPNQLTAQAIFDKQLKRPSGGKAVPVEDPTKVAESILQGAGIDVANLKKVGPLLEETKKNSKLNQQLGTRGEAPKWTQ